MAITIPYNSVPDAFAVLDRLSLRAGKDAIVDLDGTIHILDEAIDRIIQSYLRVKRQPVPEPPPEPDCYRQDRVIPMPVWAQTLLLKHRRSFVQAVAEAKDDVDAQGKAIAQWQAFRRSLRLRVIRHVAQGDVIANDTVVYGGALEGARLLEAPTGETVRALRLIHLTHPVSPEDLYLREHNIHCSSIFRYRCPGLDDGDWHTQNEPRERLDAMSYRHLLMERAHHGLH